MNKPVFHTTEELLSKLGLDESASNGTKEKINQAFLEFHVLCLDILGDGYASRVKSNNVRGQIAEYKFVRAVLLDLVDFVAIGSGTTPQEVWNEEGLAREAHEKKSLIASLKTEAKDLLHKICSPSQNSSVNVAELKETPDTYIDVFNTV